MARRSRSVPRIFFSYSHKDSEFGVRLVKLLRQVLGDETAVWYDDGLVAGEDWWNRIVKELNNRNTFIVLLSPDSLKSNYVKEEMGIAWHRRMEKNMQFIPIMYRECRIPSYLKYLNTKQFISFIPPRDHETSYKKLFEALNVRFYDEKLISNIGMVDTAEAQVEEKEGRRYSGRLGEIASIQRMVSFVEEAFNRQEWVDVVAMTKALVNLYPQFIPSSLYEMRGYACLHAGGVENSQYMLAQEAFEAALARENNPERRLGLLDAYAFTLMQQDRWDKVSNCIDEAEWMLKLAPNSFIEKMWQMLRDEMPIVYEEDNIINPRVADSNRIRVIKDVALVLLIANFLFSLFHRLLKRITFTT